MICGRPADDYDALEEKKINVMIPNFQSFVEGIPISLLCASNASILTSKVNIADIIPAKHQHGISITVLTLAC